MIDGGPVELLETHAAIDVSDHRARKEFRLLLQKSRHHGDPVSLSLDLEPGQVPVRFSAIIDGVETMCPVVRGSGRLIHLNLPAIPPGLVFTCILQTIEDLRPENGFYRVETLNVRFASAYKPLKRMTVETRITSSRPLRAIDSPTHPVRVHRQSAHEATAFFDRGNLVSTGRFRVMYSMDHDTLPSPDGPFILASGNTRAAAPGNPAASREILEPRRRASRRRAS